jgi:hypothetical protein
MQYDSYSITNALSRAAPVLVSDALPTSPRLTLPTGCLSGGQMADAAVVEW